MRAPFVSAALVVALGGCIGQTQEQPASRPPATEPTTRAGIVETVAGPGFCPRTSVRDAASEETGALSVDSEGRMFFDTGPQNDGLVATVDRDGRVGTLRHLTARGPYRTGPERLEAPAAGRLAADGNGGVYIAAGSKVVQLDQRGALTNIAGDPKHPPSPSGGESSGDGGPAQAARFSSARSVVTDEAGNLYIADAGGGSDEEVSVRMINRTAQPVLLFRETPLQTTVLPGQIQTVAGDAARGERRPGTPMTGRSVVIALSEPRLYVAASTPSERGGRRASGAWKVTLINLSGGSISAHGTIVEAGAAATLVTSGAPRDGGGGDGGDEPAIQGPITGLAADRGGNVYLADSGAHRVLKLNSAGVWELLAGAGEGRSPAGFNGNDRRARGARLNRPFSLAVGPEGRVYISDQRNRQVRFVDEAGVIRAAPAAGVGLRWRCSGSGGSGPSPPGRSRQAPLQGAPAGVAVDRRGRIFFSNSSSHQINLVTQPGRVENLAGGLRPGACAERDERREGRRSIPLSRASLRKPVSVAAGSGGVYVADCGSGRVSFINPGPRGLTVHGTAVGPRSMLTIAGSGTPGFGGDGGKASEAELGGAEGAPIRLPAMAALEDPNSIPPDVAPGALAADAKGNLYIADTGNGRVRRVGRSGTISTVAGEGAKGSLGECCRRPSGLAVDRSGNLYVLDIATLKAWFVNLGRLPVTVKGVRVPPGSAEPVAGNGTVGFEGEGGPAAAAQLLFPMGIALDRLDNLYIVEVGAALGTTLFDPVIRGVDVRKVDAGGTMTTIVGPGHVGFNGDGLKPNLTSLSFPIGIAADRCGNLLIADLGDDRVRRVNLQADCPG